MKAIWDDITIGTVPFLPANMQGNLSLLGNPKFWQSRTNVFEIGSRTSWCVTDPMVGTLEKHLDFKRMNDSAHVRPGGPPACRPVARRRSRTTWAMQYQNRFWAEHGGDAGHEGFTQMLAALGCPRGRRP